MNIKLLFFSAMVCFSIPLVGMTMYIPSSKPYGYSSNYNSVSSYSKPSYKATAKSCLQEVRKKIDKNCKLADIEKFVERKKFGNALVFVIGQEAPDLCENLLEMGADPNGSEENKGQSIREAMICCKPSGIVELLLKHGATITDRSPYGNTLLLYTMIRKYNRRVKFNNPIAQGVTLDRLRHLLAHKDSMKLINCKDKDDNTALGWALADLSDCCIGKDQCQEKEIVDIKEAIAIVDLLLVHGENPFIKNDSPDNILKLASELIKQTEYEPFLRYLPKRHQQFRKECADRLALFLTEGGEKKGSKENGDLAYGPFSRDIAIEIAKFRYHCEENYEELYEK